ncbi:MAG: exodeoxyribonuclease small subunit [Pseudomonadota bacterium]|jgi:exodeoxyribonuclease VII small subunit|nr:exodeoxyribonuclease VII small subunit [Burkholderiales bacterium]
MAQQKFEDAMAQLEKIVEQIENDEISLDEALSKYQAGVALVKFCQDKLAEAEQKIKILDTSSDSLKDFSIE